MKICLKCGELCSKSYCEECWPKVRKAQKPKRTTSAHEQGYGSRWRRLSLKARKLQPFCSDCHTDQDLQADHSPEAWERFYAGKAIRLRDIDVVCGPCNRARGQARTPGEGRSSRHAGEASRSGQVTNLYENDSQLGGE